MSGVIYIITSGDECYVGSTNDYKKRLNHHRDVIYTTNPNYKGYNYKLYKTIRANGGEWEMSIYDDNLSMSEEELCIYEEEVRLLLGATLNGRRAYTTDEQRREQKYKYANNNKDLIHTKGKTIVKCECGVMLSYNCLSRHKKTAKHIRLMTSPELP